MARHFISTAKFNPYTYQELAAPIERTTAILAQQAQNLSALEMQNAALGNYLDPEIDREAYNIYKQNEENLRRAVDDLQRTGLNSNTYNVLRDAHVAYARDIKPMQSAIMNRVQYYSTLNDMQMKYPDIVIKGPTKRPLKDFYNGVPQTQVIQGSVIQRDVADIMKQLAAAESDVKIDGNVDKYNMKVYQITGYTPEQYAQLKQDPQSFMYGVIHSVMQKHGVEDTAGNNLLNSQEDYAKMWQYANAGTYALLGSKQATLADNGYYKDVQIAHSNRDYELRKQSNNFNQNMQLLGVAASISESTGQPLSDVMTKLSNGDWSVFDPNATSATPTITFKSDGTDAGRPVDLQTTNNLTTRPNSNAADMTIGVGNSSFKRSSIAQAYGVIVGNGPISNISNKRYYKAICNRVGVVDPNNPTVTELARIKNEMSNDYRKLDYHTFVAEKSITGSENINDHIRVLTPILPAGITLPEKVSQLFYRNNTQDPLKIDVYVNSNKQPLCTISTADMLNLMSEADYNWLKLQETLPHDYVSAVQDPRVPATTAIKYMQNATQLNVNAMDLFVSSINKNIVDNKQHTNVSEKDDVSNPTYR